MMTPRENTLCGDWGRPEWHLLKRIGIRMTFSCVPLNTQSDVTQDAKSHSSGLSWIAMILHS